MEKKWKMNFKIPLSSSKLILNSKTKPDFEIHEKKLQKIIQTKESHFFSQKDSLEEKGNMKKKKRFQLSFTAETLLSKTDQ